MLEFSQTPAYARSHNRLDGEGKTLTREQAPISGQEELGLVEWSEESYRTSSRALAVVFSTLIPSLAIAILSFVHNLIGRILVAMGMSFVFWTTLALFTSVRAAEIFASTAA